jgi:RNA polymerase sigma-70 factor (ECF subfamily)
MQAMTLETTRNEVADDLEQGSSGGAERIERPEPEDFEHIYHLYSRRVYSLCLRMAGNIAEAEDLTQQAFLQAYKKLDTFRGESSFYTWLHRLAVNIVLMRLRRKRVVKEDSLEELTDPDNRSSAWHGTKLRSSDATALVAIDRVDVERALNQLPSGFRTILVLHDIEGYEHVEISGLLGCSIGTSKSQLHRARQRMRKLTREATWQKTG